MSVCALTGICLSAHLPGHTKVILCVHAGAQESVRDVRRC